MATYGDKEAALLTRLGYRAGLVSEEEFQAVVDAENAAAEKANAKEADKAEKGG